MSWKARCLMVRIIQPGFFSTIQDLGRYGNQEYGVPESGAMDRYAAKLANAILNNNENDAVIEMTMTGATLVFENPTYICVTGADMSPKLNDKPIKMNSLIVIKTGDILTLGRANIGFRGYLAVSGGFQTEKVMNSRSLFPHITGQAKLSKNDCLPILASTKTISNVSSTIKYNHSRFDCDILEVFKGPEYNDLTQEQKKLLVSMKFSISKNNNRMAYQLEESFHNELKPIITSLVLPGTVQLTPSGKLIILMRDCQTTGGYPRVLQLAESSLNILSQKFTNQQIYFAMVN